MRNSTFPAPLLCSSQPYFQGLKKNRGFGWWLQVVAFGGGMSGLFEPSGPLCSPEGGAARSYGSLGDWASLRIVCVLFGRHCGVHSGTCTSMQTTPHGWKIGSIGWLRCCLRLRPTWRPARYHSLLAGFRPPVARGARTHIRGFAAHLC